MGIGSGPAVGFFPERLLSEKENEMAILGELAEEIPRLLLQDVVDFRCVFCDEYDDFRDECALEPNRSRQCLKDAENQINNILKAVVDGELKLPGEVGRGTIDDEMGALQCFLAILPPNGMRFIALSPESHRDPRRGGQEEE